MTNYKQWSCDVGSNEWSTVTTLAESNSTPASLDGHHVSPQNLAPLNADHLEDPLQASHSSSFHSISLHLGGFRKATAKTTATAANMISTYMLILWCCSRCELPAETHTTPHDRVRKIKTAQPSGEEEQSGGGAFCILFVVMSGLTCQPLATPRGTVRELSMLCADINDTCLFTGLPGSPELVTLREHILAHGASSQCASHHPTHI